MLRKLYDKDPVWLSFFWIAVYVVVTNIALQFCDGFDNLAEKRPQQLMIPVACILAIAALSTAWIVRNGLTEHFGLCRIKKDPGTFLFFAPMVLMSCINLKNGLYLPVPLPAAVLMTINLAAAGYLEEVIFRGFLFRGMAKDNLHSAIIISAVTFGVGHIVNLVNTEDTLGVILQVCYAIAIGFLYTVLVYKSGSLWPCIISHMFVNGTSVFAREEGPFSDLVAMAFATSSSDMEQVCSAIMIIVLAGSYAVWLWRKIPHGDSGEL